MKHKLLILTGKYPFSNGETFLANELQYIPDYFDRIYIYPVLVYDSESNLTWKYEKPTNKNIEIILGNEFKKKKNVMASFSKSIGDLGVWRDIKRLLREKRMTKDSLQALVLYAMRSHYAADIVKKKILDDFSEDEDLTIYSYWMDYDAYVATLIYRRAKKKIRKIVTRCHRGDLYESAARGCFLPMRKPIFETMDRIYSISDNGIAYLKHMYPNIIKDNLSVSRLGTFDHGCYELKKSDTLKLVSCSWVRPVKRVQLIPEALREIDVNVEWTHLGNGSAMDVLQTAVDELDNPLISCHLLGECRNEKVMQLYESENYQVFINVSENEGVPVSIMEAMSFGMIIIATNVGGVGELVFEGENGYLLDKNFEITQLTDCIRKISQMSQAKMQIMSRKSREIWERKFDASTNYKKFYSELIQ